MAQSSIEILNYISKDTTHSPCIIIHGKISGKNSDKDIIVKNMNNNFVELKYEINYFFFKATVELQPGLNRLYFITKNNGTLPFDLNYIPLTSNKPIHLCLLVGKDSPMRYDTNDIKESNLPSDVHLKLAIQKLQIAARLTQAYTNEQMYRNGYSQRTMQFAEEFTDSGNYRQASFSRSNIKVHILRSSYSTKEILSPDIAQQNPNGKNRGKLFDIAIEEIMKYDNGRLIANYSSSNPIQAAVIFLDTKFDAKLNLILGHAALGGGNDLIKLAIFGSHGLYCWPSYWEDLTSIMLNNNRVVDNGLPVSNDNGEAGTVFETFSTTLGAFIHEIGHSLTLPHRTYGIMLRDYIVLHRSFMSREVLGRGNNYSKNKFVQGRAFVPVDECAWHCLDLVRFNNHECFRLPMDGVFTEKTSTAVKISPDKQSVTIENKTGGIYAVEIQDLKSGDQLSRGWHIYQNPVTQVINLNINKDIVQKSGLQLNDIALEIFAKNASPTKISNLNNFINDSSFKINGVQVTKSLLYGRETQKPVFYLFPEGSNTRFNKITVFHGGAIDGVKLFFTSGKAPVLLGNETKDFSSFDIANETIGKLKIRSGQWLDAIQFFNNKNLPIMPFVGNVNGGSEHVMEGQIVGIYGSCTQWMDGIGVLY
ncbi:hypothetical protein QEN19_000740 [Hanseniaspora menglaensis]